MIGSRPEQVVDTCTDKVHQCTWPIERPIAVRIGIIRPQNKTAIGLNAFDFQLHNHNDIYSMSKEKTKSEIYRKNLI